jgi:type IV secretory pathway TraG/TraD family ATPase VirD4
MHEKTFKYFKISCISNFLLSYAIGALRTIICQWLAGVKVSILNYTKLCRSTFHNILQVWASRPFSTIEKSIQQHQRSYATLDSYHLWPLKFQGRFSEYCAWNMYLLTCGPMIKMKWCFSTSNRKILYLTMLIVCKKISIKVTTWIARSKQLKEKIIFFW